MVTRHGRGDARSVDKPSTTTIPEPGLGNPLKRKG